MSSFLNPAFILILGAGLVPFLSQQIRKIYMLLLPVIGLACWLAVPDGLHGQIACFGLELTSIRMDPLARVFGIVFHIAAFLGVLYALHVRDTVQQVAALVYAGAAIGALLAGDLITLFVWWELTAISSVFLILARRTERATQVAIRYLIIQVASGVILLIGVGVRYIGTGEISFDFIGLDSPGGWIILFAFGIKCAFPFLHNWLQDAYPEATVTGTVILSAFTTKLAVYALARGFPGEHLLIYIGAAMTAFPIFFAVIENDLRRVLAYSLNNQLGFMVVGVGVGTELALNGTAAHAFVHIIYKALLFMSMGAVLFRTGTIKASALGGLYKSMPITAAFCIVGSMSISAFPLLSGFVAKSLIMTAAADEGFWLVSLVLLFASAGVLDHSGIKVPYFSFFAHDSGIRCREAPWNMLSAMAIAAFLCILIGIRPGLLYDLLPFAVEYHPYTSSHVVTQLQLLLFSALAFVFLVKIGRYPPEIESLNLDSDWIYRRGLPAIWQRITDFVGGICVSFQGGFNAALSAGLPGLRALAGPAGPLSRTWRSGNAILVVLILLALVALSGYLSG